jgi:hypothetical protein
MKIKIGKYNKKGEQKVSIKLDSWDTFSADHTLALIIHPMLVAYRAVPEENRGVLCGSFDEDVPVYLKSTIGVIDGSGDAEDKLQIEQWDWILCEMIWAFNTKINTDSCDMWGTIKEQRMLNGMRLFGKYFNGLWR